MEISVIPGIVSMFTFASKVGVSIAEGAEKVAIIPSCYDLAGVREIARYAESMIFLKDGRYFDPGHRRAARVGVRRRFALPR